MKLFDTVYNYYRARDKCSHFIVEDPNDAFQSVIDLVYVKSLLAVSPDFAAKLGKVDYINNEDDLNDVLNHFDASTLQATANKLKMLGMTAHRIVEMAIYAKLEGPTVSPNMHKVYRLNVKRAMYIKSLRYHPEIFKGKKEQLLKHTLGKGEELSTPYLWNQRIPGDEFGMQSIKDLQGEQGPTADEMLTAEAIKLHLKQLYEN